MHPSSFYPLLIYTFVYSITPGPNNILLAASGAAFGYRRSLPHMLGVSLGAALMLIVVGCGLCATFTRMPLLHTVLRYGAALYLLRLAWCIAHTGTEGGNEVLPQPMRFWQGLALQWINPKTWMMAVGVVAAYTPREGYFTQLLLAGALLALVSFPSISMWTLFGQWVARMLRSGAARRRFNRLMAGLLLLSLYPFVAELWKDLA
ncbi:LysE family translocator [Comamonas endophytica]|uniref:LysE family translocator n=1 Tax=Comamonas endophytica TaxID=2949090 RepID=A0ABY6G911_9BURK|nr:MULTISPECIES: LysE family translocator [unclassified Acidovorax]MCD2511791.1 LysE family translocator [Acidovorax sp. D4N7]UYG51515.1 LysE family translocator [Acidovorax sp. 5MLIR]